MTYSGIFENILRIGVIESVNYSAQKCSIRMYDRMENRTLDCALPQIAAGTDQGLFVNPDKGTLVLVGWGYSERPYIVSYLPNSSFSQDLSFASNATNVPVSAAGYPSLQKGEVALSGTYGSKIVMKNNGAVKTTAGENSITLDGFSSIFETKTRIESNSSYYHYSGEVMRDLRKIAPVIESLENKKTSVGFFRVYDQVGREPSDRVSSLAGASTGQNNTGRYRNPAFVEDRKIINEFANSYEVGTVDEEKDRYLSSSNGEFLSQPNKRSNAGYDILNLNTDSPNTLIESVLGTVVDIYGNILDINRNIISYGNDQQKKSEKSRIAYLSALTRRSIKIHYELNAKKEATGSVSPTSLEGGSDLSIGHNHSRWSFDVDGEGLTKINIPASSNTGNIPLLSRHVSGHMYKNGGADADTTKARYEILNGKERPTQDVFHLAFGDKGPGLTIPDEYAPSDIAKNEKVKYRTAYHDIVTTASLAMRDLPSPGPAGIGAFLPSVEPPNGTTLSMGGVATSSASSPAPTSPGANNTGSLRKAIFDNLNNSLSIDGSNGNANAGGRSIFANLDGSLELNVGRDFADHKSLVIDTSGGILSRIGKMRSSSASASVISQLDGSVFIQIGGDAVGNESSTTESEVLQDPRVRIVVVGSLGTDEIIIDKKYFKIKSAGEKGTTTAKNIILESAGDIILNAQGKILLMGKTVGVHGEVDVDGQITKGPERHITKTGKII